MRPSVKNQEFLHCLSLIILLPVDLSQTVVFYVVPIQDNTNTTFMLKQLLFIEDFLRFIILKCLKQNNYAKEFLSCSAEINYHGIKFSAECYIPTIHNVMS